jgi:hypothetical protein
LEGKSLIEAMGLYQLNKGACEVKVSTGPILVKLLAEGFIEHQDLLQFFPILSPMKPGVYHGKNCGLFKTAFHCLKHHANNGVKKCWVKCPQITLKNENRLLAGVN